MARIITEEYEFDDDNNFFAHYCDDFEIKLDQLKRFLETQGVSIFHEVEGAMMVEFKHKYWLISENGGELMIGKVNSEELDRSIAYTDWDSHLTHKILGAGTIGLRVMSALKEEQIDWGFDMPDADLLVII